MSPEAVPLFVLDYGDYCHTQQALPVTEVRGLEEAEVIQESAYSKSGLALEEVERRREFTAAAERAGGPTWSFCGKPEDPCPERKEKTMLEFAKLCDYLTPTTLAAIIADVDDARSCRRAATWTWWRCGRWRRRPSQRQCRRRRSGRADREGETVLSWRPTLRQRGHPTPGQRGLEPSVRNPTRNRSKTDGRDGARTSHQGPPSGTTAGR